MKNIAALIAGSALALGSFVPFASAYGGGPGFPPGFSGPVVCHMKTIHLPFNMSVDIPICRPGLHTGWKDRWNDFVTRVVHGNQGHGKDS
jgi:hypothetical protein